MSLNLKRMSKYLIMLLIGLSLIFYGMIKIVIEDHSMKEVSDEEVIRRAKELGFVEIKELYLKDLEESE